MGPNNGSVRMNNESGQAAYFTPPLWAHVDAQGRPVEFAACLPAAPARQSATSSEHTHTASPLMQAPLTLNPFTV